MAWRKDLPLDRLRDRVLFETAYVCGARAGEVCGRTSKTWTCARTGEQSHRIHGKGGTVRTVLLDDRGYVALLKLYLERTKYKAGPLFGPASMDPVGRCPTTPRSTGGPGTAPSPVSTSTSTSCATLTPPS